MAEISIETAGEKLNSIYRGVVEDRNDPKKAGRVKVRVLGVHTKVKVKSDIEGIPTDELPWAQPVAGLIEGSITGMGQFAVPLQGSHVFVFFENGNHMQPRYFGTVPAIPKDQPSTSEGFSDPEGKYPLSHRLNEPDFHRLSRGETSETIVPIKEENRDKDIEVAGGKSWDEPEPYYAAEYPDNIVINTHGGHLIELDCTPGNERFHLYHGTSNSYTEIDKDGNIIIRNNQDKYEIVISNKHIHVKGDEYFTVEGNRKKLVIENENHEVRKNYTFRNGPDIFDPDGNKVGSAGDDGDIMVEVIGNEIKKYGEFSFYEFYEPLSTKNYVGNTQADVPVPPLIPPDYFKFEKTNLEDLPTFVEPPLIGGRYYVGIGARGEWEGQDGKIATGSTGAWSFEEVYPFLDLENFLLDKRKRAGIQGKGSKEIYVGSNYKEVIGIPDSKKDGNKLSIIEGYEEKVIGRGLRYTTLMEADGIYLVAQMANINLIVQKGVIVLGGPVVGM